MRHIRNRARTLAAIALAWHALTMAAVSTVLSCDHSATAEQAGMEECPLHAKPTCPLHAENHGKHNCDCPTIGCARTDTGFTALFGAVGVLPIVMDMPLPDGIVDATPVISSAALALAPVPLSPPPRT